MPITPYPLLLAYNVSEVCMDFFLDDETVDKMNAEYAKNLKNKANTLCVSEDLLCGGEAEEQNSQSVCARTRYIRFLFLYIAVFLSYNNLYGTQIYDTHGSVGRLRPDASSFGSVNRLF